MIKVRDTTLWEKLGASMINILVVAAIFTIVYVVIAPARTEPKLVFIGLFLVYSLLFAVLNNGRDIGMIAVGSFWRENYSLSQHLIFCLLYTLSFSTLLFSIWFPFDLLIFNLAFLQLPCVLLTKTTLHGYLSGNMISVKQVK